MRREIFLDTIRSLIGTPYKHNGCSVHGVDCGNLVLLAYKLNGWQLPAAFDLRDNQLVDYLCANFIAAPNPQPGDILLMRIRSQPEHIAVLDTDDHMIHVTQTTNRVERAHISRLWRCRIMGAFTHV